MVLALSIKIHAQEITLIPDSIFEQVLIEKGIDSDGEVNGQILTSDAEGVTKLEINMYDTWDQYPSVPEEFFIQDFTGLESFVNIDTLVIQYTYASQIPLNTLTELRHLDVLRNNLDFIDVSANTQLRSILVRDTEYHLFYDNALVTELDLSQNPYIEHIVFVNYSYPHSPKFINLNNGNNNPNMYMFIGMAMEGLDYETRPRTCILVDNPEDAEAGDYPYSEWNIVIGLTNVSFADDMGTCFLSVPKEEKLGISVYPNPVSEMINFENLKGEVEFILYDLTGKKLVSKTLHSGNSPVDVNFLSEGLYVYKITDSAGSIQSGKLVKE